MEGSTLAAPALFLPSRFLFIASDSLLRCSDLGCSLAVTAQNPAYDTASPKTHRWLRPQPNSSLLFRLGTERAIFSQQQRQGHGGKRCVSPYEPLGLCPHVRYVAAVKPLYLFHKPLEGRQLRNAAVSIRTVDCLPSRRLKEKPVTP